MQIYADDSEKRYLQNKRLLQRLRSEADCCASVSIIYTSRVSTSHAAEPKYTSQDMVTTISGNVEAWLGLSAVHTYAFLEELYDALLEARLIRPLSSALCAALRAAGAGQPIVALTGALNSILTKVKFKLFGRFQ